MATHRKVAGGTCFEGNSSWKGAAALLLESAGDTSSGMAVDEEAEDGNYLRGSPANIYLVQNHLLLKASMSPANLKHENFSLSHENTPEEVIRAFFSKHKGKNVIIYFTGHGSKDGSWCFTLYGRGNKKVRVSPDAVVNWYREATAGQSFKSLSVVSQSCFSGRWCQVAEANPDIFTLVYTSATPGQKSCSSSDGSEVTKFLFHDGPAPKNSQPLFYHYSNSEDSDRRYSYSMIGFIQLKADGQSPQTPLALDFHRDDQDKFSVSLGWTKSLGYATGATKWGFRDDAATFWADYLKFRSDGYRLTTLACNGKWIGFYVNEGFGSEQMLCQGSTDYVKPLIEKNWEDGYGITTVCPNMNTGWYVVMTKGGSDDTKWPLKGPNGDSWFTRNSWGDTSEEMSKLLRQGKIVTSMCHNNGQYFCVMSASSRAQVTSSWSADWPKEWIKSQWDNGYAITTIFKDPTDSKWKLWMTHGVPTGAWTSNRKCTGDDY